MKIIDCKQGTEEWFELHKDKMTASHAYCIATGGKGLNTYCRKIAAQIYTGIIPATFKDKNMQTGNDEEEYARIAYELSTGNKVEIIGFGIYDEYTGASPDGLVREDGGIEIKRKTFEKHNDLLLGAEEFEEGYIWQCKMNMLVFDRSWWDLISYNPNFKENSLFIKRIERNKEDDRKLIEGLKKGKQLIQEYLNMYNKKN